jgi:molecular chaperone GrpE
MAKEEEKEFNLENNDNSEVAAEKESNQETETAENIEEPDELTKAQTEAAELKDKYLRLYSEFDNYRRRTSKEKAELIKTANEDLLTDLLPILDDFQRGRKSIETSSDIEALKEGIDLIYNKLLKTLEAKGLKAMDSPFGKEFDSELQEAITQVQAPEEGLKGKVIDEIEKGYYLNEKVIRFAKVIIGS